MRRSQNMAFENGELKCFKCNGLEQGVWYTPDSTKIRENLHFLSQQVFSRDELFFPFSLPDQPVLLGSHLNNLAFGIGLIFSLQT